SPKSPRRRDKVPAHRRSPTGRRESRCPDKPVASGTSPDGIPPGEYSPEPPGSPPPGGRGQTDPACTTAGSRPTETCKTNRRTILPQGPSAQGSPAYPGGPR